MPTRKRTRLAVAAATRNQEQCARLGQEVRSARRARGWTQTELGARVGLGPSTISRAERGLGGGLSLDTWQRIGHAVLRPLVVGLQRDVAGDTADAAHLAMQELVLRLGRRAGYAGRIELATRPSEPWRSADVGLIDDRRRRLVLAECWNTIGDVGAAARASERKRAEAEAIALARWGEPAPDGHGGPGADRCLGGARAWRVGADSADHEAAVGLVWVVRASMRNRTLVARYPEVFAARFPGSSRHWVEALTHGTAPPNEPGLVWCDLGATRLFAWRRR